MFNVSLQSSPFAARTRYFAFCAAVVLMVLTLGGYLDWATKMLDQAPSVESVLRAALSDDLGERQWAHAQLYRLSSQHFPSEKEGLQALSAALESARRGGGMDSALLEFASKSMHESYGPWLVEHYIEFPAESRAEIIKLAHRAPADDRFANLIEIIRRHAATGAVSTLPLIRADEGAARDLLPELLPLVALPELQTEVALLLLQLLENGHVADDLKQRFEQPVLTAVLNNVSMYDQLARESKTDETAEELERLHWAIRFQTAVLAEYSRETCLNAIDEIGRLPSPAIQLAAIRTRLRHEFDLPAGLVQSVANNADTRARLLFELQQANRGDLFPAEHLNQQSLAESHMAEWLAFPTELGKPPEELILLGVLGSEIAMTPDSRVQKGQYFIFRFRDAETCPEWKVGWSGPYESGSLTIEPPEFTFSSFEEWEPGRDWATYIEK